MSRQIKRKIAYWFMLLLGILIMVMQVRKYFLGTLEMKWEELIVFTIGFCLVWNPLSIVGLIQTVINSKYGKNTND